MPFRVELGEVIPQNFLMPYEIETSSGYDALLPRKTAEFLSLVENGKIEERISRVRLIRNFNSTSCICFGIYFYPDQCPGFFFQRK